MKILAPLATAFTASLLTLSASAAPIIGSTADNAINATPALRTVTSVDEVVKTGNTLANGRNVVFSFQLPTLNPGEFFGTAELSFTLLQNGTTQVSGGAFGASTNPTFNLDLYGLGRRAASTVEVGDVFFGAVPDVMDATLLDDDFITSATPVGTAMFSGATLAAYLNTQYAAGAGAGEFVFLRLNPDAAAATDASNSQNYRVSMADNTGATAYAKITPQVEFTIVPEPGSAALISLGLLALGGRRVRRKA